MPRIAYGNDPVSQAFAAEHQKDEETRGVWFKFAMIGVGVVFVVIATGLATVPHH